MALSSWKITGKHYINIELTQFLTDHILFIISHLSTQSFARWDFQNGYHVQHLMNPLRQKCLS